MMRSGIAGTLLGVIIVVGGVDVYAAKNTSQLPRCLQSMTTRSALAPYVDYLRAKPNVLRAFNPCQFQPSVLGWFMTKLADAETVFWNGPMGVFEHPDYAEGTKAVAQALVESKGFTVVGGGDSAAAVRTLGFDENAFGHISTGGGASLEYLEGKTLPGLAALED